MQGLLVERGEEIYRLADDYLDELFQQERPMEALAAKLRNTPTSTASPEALRAPIGRQEVWAAGVSYQRSREARIEESERDADIYDRVYTAERPELFFKATAHRVVGHQQPISIRRDSNWNVPEAELTLAVSAAGTIFGYTIGNDVSSRQLEGENPLYLSQAKIWDGSCSLGPSILVTQTSMPPATAVELKIRRGGNVVFAQATTLAKMKRRPEDLVEYLFRECSFPFGVFLMTGTGIVPEATLSLQPGDNVEITIDGLGTLQNPVTCRAAAATPPTPPTQ